MVNQGIWQSGQIIRAAVFILCIGIIFNYGQIEYTDSTYGCRIKLFDHWVPEYTDSLDLIFIDTSNFDTSSQSSLGINRIPLNGDDRSNPEEWVKNHFIAYKGEIDSGQEYISSLIYYDSSHSKKIETRWAPELFYSFWDHSEFVNYAEFVIITHANNFGYELYALGDSADVMNNISKYTTMLYSVTFFKPSTSIHKIFFNANSLNENVHFRRTNRSAFNLLGQARPIPPEVRGFALKKALITEERKLIILRH